MSPVATGRAFTLQEPETFLRAMSTDSREIRLDGIVLTEMCALAGAAALGRRDGESPLTVTWEEDSLAHRFARAVGFDEVLVGSPREIRGEAGRTVRLSRVADEADIRPVAFEIARLLAGEEPPRADARLVVEYVMIELLRNVLQHSDDHLGAVIGAQLNDRGRHASKPVFQVAVADHGKGIRATLSRTHTDITDDEVALEQSLWPYHSGAFAPGQSGGLENAGLGLFYISEMAKAVNGRLLVASGSASLVVDPTLPRRIDRLPVGFPGTLVAFEVPTEASQNFNELFEHVSAIAREQSPQRLTTELIKFEAPPSDTTRFMVNAFLENNDEALKLSREQLVPRMVKGQPVALDFVNVRVITQSFAHALLFDALRFAWAGKSRIFVLNAQPVVRSALRHVEMYSQTG